MGYVMRRKCWIGFLLVALVGSSSAFSTTTTSRNNALARTQQPLLIPQASSWQKASLCPPPLWLSKDKDRRSQQVTLAAETSDDPLFDGRTTVSLVGGQTLLILAAVIAALILGVPNFGLGPGISFSQDTLVQGAQFAIPLFAIAFLLDTIEERYPALQDVTIATQRSVIALLGGTLKPLLALSTSLALGLAAGFGEEMLFRGVLQYELASRFGTVVGVLVSSIVFGALHAVTPLYALLATLASVFFGSLYEYFENLAVPIATHAVYDVGALLWAHWTVTQMTDEERDEIVNWEGPTTKR